LPKEEGRKVIQALRQLIEQMRAARFDNPKGVECETNRRYELSLGRLKEVGELNMSDHGIRDTLSYNYDISLSVECRAKNTKPK